jgi:hypothetical protein
LKILDQLEYVAPGYMKLAAKVNKSVFFASELLQARLSHRPTLKILFSQNSEREHNIRIGFKYLHYQVQFAAFTEQNVRDNDLVVPLNMDDLRDLAKLPSARYNLIPTPCLDVIDLCDDKYLFAKTLQEKGFGDVIPKISDNLPFPFVLKKKVSVSGDFCYLITNAETEKKFINLKNDPDYFCQELIRGPEEYATHILFIGQKIVSSINVKYIFGDSSFVKGKDKFICNKLVKCPHLELFASILIAIGYEGLCCFNYKEVNGQPMLLEINPRFGGSLSTFFFSFLRKIEVSRASVFEMQNGI